MKSKGGKSFYEQGEVKLAHHQHRGYQMRSVWEIWLECRLYIAGKGEDHGLVITSDQGTNFTSCLTKEFLKMFGVAPRVNTPGHPESSGIVEDGIKHLRK